MKNTTKNIGVITIMLLVLTVLCSCNQNVDVPSDKAEYTARAVKLSIEEDKTIRPDKEMPEFYHVRMVHTTGEVYDSGYFTREDMAHEGVCINPNGDHKILTGKYDVEIEGCVLASSPDLDGVGKPEYVVVEKDVDSVTVTLDTSFLIFHLGSLNHDPVEAFEFDVVLTDRFFEAIISDSNTFVNFTGTATAIDGRELVVYLEGEFVERRAENMVRIRMHATGNEDGMGGRLTGGLYTLSVKAELFLDGKEIVDTRSGIAVLRVIPGLETNGTIDLSYGATVPETIRIDIDDTAAIELKDFETFEGGAREFQGTPNRDGDWTVTFPTYDVENSTGTWYINGEEISAGMFEKSVRGDHTTFTVPEAYFEPGINVVTCLFVYDSGRVGDYTANVTYRSYTGDEVAM